MPRDLIQGVVLLRIKKTRQSKNRAPILIQSGPIRLYASHVSLFDLHQMFRASMGNRSGSGSAAGNPGHAVMSVTSETTLLAG